MVITAELAERFTAAADIVKVHLVRLALDGTTWSEPEDPAIDWGAIAAAADLASFDEPIEAWGWILDEVNEWALTGGLQRTIDMARGLQEASTRKRRFTAVGPSGRPLRSWHTTEAKARLYFDRFTPYATTLVDGSGREIVAHR